MGTFVVGVIIAGIIFLAARKVYRDKKNGAGCGCSDCSGCTACPQEGTHKPGAK